MTYLDEAKENIMKFSNPELDRRIGGLPLPSLTLIEGPNDSGKSILSQQITYGALSSGFDVLYITTEDTSKGVITNMEKLNWKIVDYFLLGNFKITSLNTLSMKWDSEISKYYLTALTNYIRKRTVQYDFIIIDSITYLLTHAEPQDVLDFFSNCRNIVENSGKSFVLSIHPYALDKEVLIRVRALCDGHLVLEIKTFRDKDALTINVAKLKGAVKNVIETISFEVSPAYGIKVLPFSTARG
jgi:flagellar protein FlaH